MKIGGSLGKIANQVKDVTSNLSAPEIAATILGGPGVASVIATKRGAEANKEKQQKAKTASDERDAAAKASAVQIAAQQAAERQQSIDPLRAIANTAAPQMTAPTVDPTFRNAQVDLLKHLQGQADGTAPSLAQMQQKQASNKAMQNTLGAIRSGIGSNAALGARTAALAGGNQMADLANQSAILRLKEQQDAMNAIAGVSNQGRAGDATTRGQDIGVASTNQQAEMQQRALGAGINQAILNSDVGRQEGWYNRGASVAGRQQAGGGQNDLLKTAITVGAPILATMAGGPAAGAAAAAVTKPAVDAVMPSEPSMTQMVGDDTTPVNTPIAPGASLVEQQRKLPAIGNPLLPKARKMQRQ